MRLPGMDEHTTDLGPAPERTDDERRAVAGLLDVAGGGRPGGAPGGGSSLLAGVQRRAARQHRRRLAGAAVAGVAALGVVAMVVPAVVPGGGSGIVAALGLEDRGAAPAPDTAPAPPPSEGTGIFASTFDDAGDSMMLTDAQVEAFVGGVQGRAPGSLGNGNADRLPDDGLSLTVGGWCRDADLPMRVAATAEGAGDPSIAYLGPRGRWSATWRADAPTRGGVGVDEVVVKWAFDKPYLSDAGTARSYVDATGASSVRCGAGAGRDLAGDFRVLPPPLPGAVQAVASVAGAPETWEVRTVGSAEGSGAAVDLTTLLSAPTAQEAGRTVVPLLRQALDRVTAREAVERAASDAEIELGAPASSTAPQRVVVRPYGRSRTDPSLMPDQVATVLPGTVSELLPPGADDPSSSGCVGRFRAPEASRDSNTTSESVSGVEILDGSARTTVAERLFSWSPSGPGSMLLGLDSPCGPAPEGETWEPVMLSHDGADVPVVLRHPGGDPERWVVRATDAAEPAVAVGLEIETTASSQADVAAIVVPLLEAAQRQAYAANFVPSAP